MLKQLRFNACMHAPAQPYPVGEDYVLNGIERPRVDHPHVYVTCNDIITSLACCDLMMVLKPMMGLGRG